MSRMLSFDCVKRRTTPASVSLGLLLGYACWGTYGVIRERARMLEAELITSRASASKLARVKPTWNDVQRDFDTETFREGDPVERLLTARQPTFVIHHPPYMTMSFQGQSGEFDWWSRVEVVARDGKLVEAKTYIATGPREYSEVLFFGDGGLLFSAEYNKTFMAGFLRWQADNKTAVMAVTGTAAVYGLAEPTAD